jgi:1,4-dihydroxy-2-naphthoate octaprenyltransferase
MSQAVAAVPSRASAKQKLIAFIQLGKLQIVELWLGVPIAWTLLTPAHRTGARTWMVLGLAALIEIGTTSAALALDDVSGYRDGVDFANHHDTDRYGVNKPLLDGRLSEREALIFAWSAAAVALVSLVVVFAVAPFLPWWEPVAAVATVALAINYSYGARLSYIGGCELVTLLAMIATVILPYALLTGTLPLRTATEALLIGLWMLQIALFSNTQDAAGDREAGRLTLAARVDLGLNRRVITITFALSATIAASALAAGVLPWPIALLLIPTWLLQITQLRSGVRSGQWLRARALGFNAFRLGLVALLIGNLIAT